MLSIFRDKLFLDKSSGYIDVPCTSNKCQLLLSYGLNKCTLYIIQVNVLYYCNITDVVLKDMEDSLEFDVKLDNDIFVSSFIECLYTSCFSINYDEDIYMTLFIEDVPFCISLSITMSNDSMLCSILTDMYKELYNNRHNISVEEVLEICESDNKPREWSKVRMKNRGVDPRRRILSNKYKPNKLFV